mmetsp:Transcript_72184/g.202588  ORF Transcript_72184/g.202588 Transcript_72184/m.202588 type:complete len:261 (-) Transcript_72184:252-1034(-)
MAQRRCLDESADCRPRAGGRVAAGVAPDDGAARAAADAAVPEPRREAGLEHGAAQVAPRLDRQRRPVLRHAERPAGRRQDRRQGLQRRPVLGRRDVHGRGPGQRRLLGLCVQRDPRVRPAPQDRREAALGRLGHRGERDLRQERRDGGRVRVGEGGGAELRQLLRISDRRGLQAQAVPLVQHGWHRGSVDGQHVPAPALPGAPPATGEAAGADRGRVLEGLLHRGRGALPRALRRPALRRREGVGGRQVRGQVRRARRGR